MVGDSLILERVRATLENCLGLEVLVLDQPFEAPREEIDADCPAAIIFDGSGIQPDFLLPLFQQPELLLVGIDPETHRAPEFRLWLTNTRNRPDGIVWTASV